MYMPKSFVETRPEVLQQLILAPPFAVVVTHGATDIAASANLADAAADRLQVDRVRDHDGCVDEDRHQSPSWLRRICAFMTSQSSTGAFLSCRWMARRCY